MEAEYKSQCPPATSFIVLKVYSLRIIMTSGALFLFMGISQGKESQQQ